MRYVGALVLLVSLFGCTGDIGDDGKDWPPPTDVQLIVRDGFVVQPNIHVLFQASDESIISEVVTDGNGFAQAQMPNGGNVTVIRSYPGQIPARPDEIYTYVAVKPGDRLVIGNAKSVTLPSAINVKVPLADGNQNTTYRVTTPCGGGEGQGPLVAITIDGCPADTDFYISGNGQSGLAHAAVSENVDLSTMGLTQALSSSLSALGVVPDTTVDAEIRVASKTGYVLYSSGAKRVDQTAATVDLPDITGVDQFVSASVARAAGGGRQMVITHDEYQGVSTTVDVGILLPYVTEPRYEPLSIQWTEDGVGAAPADFVIATLNITKDGATDPPGPGQEYIRTIVAPYTGAMMRMPSMPGAYAAAYNPQKDDQIAGTHAIATATNGGYDAIRPRIFAAESIGEIAPMGSRTVLSYPGNTPPGR